jgi:hypothetical protein
MLPFSVAVRGGLFSNHMEEKFLHIGFGEALRSLTPCKARP